MKAWLKGGLIGVGISVILIIIFILCGLICVGDEACIGCLVFGIPLPGVLILLSEPFNFISNIILRKTSEWLVFSIFSIVIYFLIGALIGWIVGKIKSKKAP